MIQEPLDVLLVEDNEGDVEMTQRAFSDSKSTCNIYVANNGMEALDFLHKRGDFSNAPKVQLILLDLNMPRMGGKAFLENVKAESGLKAIPVIIFTSSQSPDDIRACYERHASAYIIKPFDGNEYMEVVRQVVFFWSKLGRLP